MTQMRPLLDPAALYETIRRSQAKGYTPSHTELARAFDVHVTRISFWLHRLEDAGLLTIQEAQSRRITLRRPWQYSDEALRGDWAGSQVYPRPIRIPVAEVAPAPSLNVRWGLYKHDPRVVYDFVRDYNQRHHAGPTLREIAAHLAGTDGRRKVSTSNAARVVGVLATAGLVGRRGVGFHNLFVLREWGQADEALRAHLEGRYAEP